MTALTALDPAKHVHAVSILRRGARFRRELWAATSADGTWHYRRQENAGTTWNVTHLPTGRTDEHYPSLRSARASTAAGVTLHRLDNPPPPSDPRRGCQHVSQWTGRHAGCLHAPDPTTGLCAMHAAARVTA